MNQLENFNQPQPDDQILDGQPHTRTWHSLNPNDVLLFSQHETYLVGGYQEKIQQTIVNTLSGDLYEFFKEIRDKASHHVMGGGTSGQVKLFTKSEEISCQTLRVDGSHQGWQQGLLKIQVETFFEFAADHYDVNFHVTVLLEFSPEISEIGSSEQFPLK